MGSSVFVASVEGYTGKSTVALGLLEEHMSHCVAQAVAAGGEEADAKLKEAAEAIARLVRS